MKIQCLPIKMTEAEAIKMARGGGNLLGKLIYGKQKITLRTMYLESRCITFEMTYQAKLRFGKAKNQPPKTQKIRSIVETTTCVAAHLPEALDIVTREVEENDIQNSYYSDDRLIDAARFACKRMVRRQVGRHVHINMLSMETVYRPFYIAIYGDGGEGAKARYLPIPADGFDVKRTI